MRGPYRRRTQKRFNSQINVTPFVDVILVLLIVFMIAAPMLQTGVEVNLPQAKAAALKDKSDPLVISYTSKKQLFLQKRSYTFKTLLVRLKHLKELNKNLNLYLKADRSLNYGDVVHIMASLAEAGFENVALVTET